MATRTVHICDTCKRESTEAMPFKLQIGGRFTYTVPERPTPRDGNFCTIGCGLEFVRTYLTEQIPAPAPEKKRWFRKGKKPTAR